MCRFTRIPITRLKVSFMLQNVSQCMFVFIDGTLCIKADCESFFLRDEKDFSNCLKTLELLICLYISFDGDKAILPLFFASIFTIEKK